MEREIDGKNLNQLFLHPVMLLNGNERSLSYEGSFEDIYHQKRNGKNYDEIWFKNNRLTAFSPLQKSFLRGNFAVCFAEEGFKLRILSETKSNLDLGFNRSFSQLIFAKRLFTPLIEMGIGTKILEISGKRFWDYSLELGFSPINRMKFGLAHRNLNFNYFLKLHYEDSFMDVPVDLVSEENNWYFNFDLISDMQFSLNYYEAKLKKGEKLSRKTKFSLEPQGDIFGFSSRVNLKLSPNLKLYFGKKKNYLKSMGDFYYQSQKFAKVTSIRIIADGSLCGVAFDLKKKHIFSSEVELIKILAEGKGHLETWPFTPTLIDLLGERYYFRLNGEAKIIRIGTAYDSPELPFLHLKIRGSLDYLNIRPSGKATTWNPVFFTFGIRNLKEHFLEYQEIDGLLVKLGFTHKFKNLSLGYNFFQFVLLHKKTRKTEGEKSNANITADSIEKSTRGGTTHLFSLSYQLPW